MTKEEPVAYFYPQKGGFYWAKPTKIEAPITVDVEPLPLYTTPQTKGCDECGVGGGYALYCLACAEKFAKLIEEKEPTDAVRYQWLRNEFLHGRETYLAEGISSGEDLDKYIDEQLRKKEKNT